MISRHSKHIFLTLAALFYLGTAAPVYAGQDADNPFGHGSSRVDALAYAPPYYPYSQPIYYSPGYASAYVAPAAPPPQVIEEAPADYCREYSQLVRVGGEMRETYGTACLQQDGSWKAVD